MALPVLLRKDSGFDSAKLLFTVAPGKDHWATMDRRFVFLGQMEPNTSEQSLLGWDIGIGRRMCWKAGGETGNIIDTPSGAQLEQGNPFVQVCERARKRKKPSSNAIPITAVMNNFIRKLKLVWIWSIWVLSIIEDRYQLVTQSAVVNYLWE